jgi:putative DNA primase/helicase
MTAAPRSAAQSAPQRHQQPDSAPPAELCNRHQWVTWKLEDGRKVPYDARTGRKARSTDPTTWATYEQARSAAQRRKHAGVGYVFTADDPYTGIDLDDCIDEAGTVASWAQTIVDAMQTYTEISPSGTGLKMWVIGSIPRSVKTPTIEMYSERRYFTVTGRQLPGTPATIRAAGDELAALYQSLRPAPAPHPATVAHPTTASADDDHARRYALGALEGEQKKMLDAGDRERHPRRYDSAYALAGLIPHITEEEITAAIAVNFGRDRVGAMKTIADAIAAGRQAPRQIPPPREPIARSAGPAEPDEPDDLDDLDPAEIRRHYRAAIADRDRWKDRAQRAEAALDQVKGENRFVTQTHGAEGIGAPSMRLTFVELKKELDRVPLEEREPGQWIKMRPAYMAACTGQNPSTITRHLDAMEKAGLIEKQVHRTFDPEQPKGKQWSTETAVRPLVDLSDPSQIVIPSKPRGRQACSRCGSEKLVREVRIICADCKHEQAFTQEFVNPPEPEMQIAIQDAAPQDAIAFFDGQPDPAEAASLKCNVHHKESVATVSLSEMQIAFQDATHRINAAEAPGRVPNPAPRPHAATVGRASDPARQAAAPEARRPAPRPHTGPQTPTTPEQPHPSPQPRQSPQEPPRPDRRGISRSLPADDWLTYLEETGQGEQAAQYRAGMVRP